MEAAPVEEEKPLPLITNRAIACLTDDETEFSDEFENPCPLLGVAQNSISETYHKGETPVVLTIAAFRTNEEAEQAMLDLWHFNRRIGQTGNYVLLGLRSVDYYYSFLDAQFGFTWSQGPYIYNVYSPSLNDLENVVKNLPY